ncbi:MAG: hypothetical protein WBA15_01290 [Mesorhizobium sp.]
MTTIVDDLRKAAANPAALSKAEMIDLLLVAAERIEAKRMALARVSHDNRYSPKQGAAKPTTD